MSIKTKAPLWAPVVTPPSRIGREHAVTPSGNLHRLSSGADPLNAIELLDADILDWLVSFSASFLGVAFWDPSHPWVYVLLDPDADYVMYVGQTVLPLAERLQKHLYESTRTSSPVYNWIAGLRAAGKVPIIRYVDFFTENDAIDAIGLENLLNVKRGNGGRKPKITWTAKEVLQLGRRPATHIAREKGIGVGHVWYCQRRMRDITDIANWYLDELRIRPRAA